MNDVIRQFIGKNCEITCDGLTLGATVGEIQDVSDSWVSVRTKRGVELLNCAYISRVREMRERKKAPRKGE
jgi:hypothetical protein